MNKDFGVIYLAFGKPYLAMAANSFKSLRATNPGVGACIVTNVDADPQVLRGWDKDLDKWIFLDADDLKNRHYKTSIFSFSPFDKTLYLDCDTVVLTDVSPIRFYLDFFDVAARPGKSPGPELDRDKLLFSGQQKFSDLPNWNGGIIAFRKSNAAEDFFDLWNKCYDQLGFKRDQPALIEAMFRSRCRILPLEPRWNNGDNLNGDGLFDKSESRDRTAIWHYKWDIDDKMVRDIMASATDLFGEDVSDVRAFLGARSPAYSLRHPRQFAKGLLRQIRGRLPERIRKLNGCNDLADGERSKDA